MKKYVNIINQIFFMDLNSSCNNKHKYNKDVILDLKKKFY